MFPLKMYVAWPTKRQVSPHLNACICYVCHGCLYLNFFETTMPKGKVFRLLKIILTAQTRRTGPTNVQIKLLENETQQLVVKTKRLSQEF